MALDEEGEPLHKEFRDGRIFGLALLSVGLILVAFLQVVQSAFFVLLSEGAVAKVTSVTSEKIYGGRSGPTTVYRPVLSFQGPTGRPYQVTSPETSRRRPFVGEELPIRYDPANPSELRGASFWELWGYSLLFAGAGGVGMTLFLWWRRRQILATD